MTGFRFQTVKEMIVQDQLLAGLGRVISDRFPCKRPLIVTDAGLLALGFAGQALTSLYDQGMSPHIFSEVIPDPDEETIINAAKAARLHQADMIIGLGGGSSMDAAKLAAVLAVQSLTNDQDDRQLLRSFYGVDQLSGGRLPLVQIPTTAGSGSEMTPVAIVTTGADSKMGVVSSVLLADLVLLDAALTLGLPKALTAYTAIDAMVHAIEAFTSKIKKNPMSDHYAKQTLSLIGPQLPKVLADGSDLTARRDILLGASMAGTAFANAPVGAVHALAYPLGARFHIPHGLSNALLLPAVLRYNTKVAGGLYAELAGHVGVGHTAEDFIQWLEGLIKHSDLPIRLRDFDIAKSDLDQLAADSQLQTRLLVNNPRDVDQAAAYALYEQVW